MMNFMGKDMLDETAIEFMKEVLDDALGTEGKNTFTGRLKERELKMIDYMKNTLGLSTEDISKATGLSNSNVSTKLRENKALERPIGVPIVA